MQKQATAMISGYFEYGRGTGYAFERGGLSFRGPGGAASLHKLVLNTAKGRFSAKIDGRDTVLAYPERVDGRPTRYGLEVAVKRLALTGAGARALNRALGLKRVFVAGSALATARVEGETYIIPVSRTSLEFSFDEGFRQKLADLGVIVAPTGSAQQLGSVPLAFSFPDAAGSGNQRLSISTISRPVRCDFLEPADLDRAARPVVEAGEERLAQQPDRRASPRSSASSRASATRCAAGSRLVGLLVAHQLEEALLEARRSGRARGSRSRAQGELADPLAGEAADQQRLAVVALDRAAPCSRQRRS